jgi:methionyl-tRNA formyltransferase
MKRVIVLGKGDLAIRVADWFVKSNNFQLTHLVPVMPEPSWTQSLTAWGRANGVAIIESGHYRDLPGVAEEGWSVDLAVSVFYDKIIKAWFIDKCKQIINLHNGPLPKYRGVSPINWALKNGEIEHGLTIHEITPGIDDGPIIAQVKYSIYPEFDEVIEVYGRALEFGWTLFQQSMPLIEKIQPRVQNESEATYYDKHQDVRLGERRNFTKAQSRLRTE